MIDPTLAAQVAAVDSIGVVGAVKQVLGSNEFMSGGLVLMALGAVLTIMRRVPAMIWSFLQRKFTIQLDVRDPEAFRWFEEWLATERKSTCRVLSAAAVNGKEDDPQLIFAPGRGNHLFRFKRRWVWLNRSKEEGGGSGGGRSPSDFMDMMSREMFSLQTYGRDPAILTELMADARRLFLTKRKDEVSVYYNTSWGDWNRTAVTKPRALDSVIMRDDVKEKLVADIAKFLSREDWYTALGIPYRRGYLLDGPPGCGKSSLVKALASHFKLDLYVLSLSSSSLTDENLLKAVNNAKPKAILLLEDVDSIFVERTSGKDGGVTFSGLLNAIDGVAAQEGRILVMTTNHKSRLDEALIRPGRADVHQYIDYADATQAKRMFLRFYPDEDELAEEFTTKLPSQGIAVAALQNHFTMREAAPRRAVDDPITNETPESKDDEVGGENPATDDGVAGVGECGADRPDGTGEVV